MLAGRAFVSRALFRRNYAGAVLVDGGRLEMSDSELVGNRALEGGALRVSGGRAELSRCLLAGNHAKTRGGGLLVSGGQLELANGTFLSGNTAQEGRSLFVSSGDASYVLPAPLARWVFIPSTGELRSSLDAAVSARHANAASMRGGASHARLGAHEQQALYLA